MRKAGTFFVVVVSLLVGLVACGDGDIGEECEEEGRIGGECVDGAVCGRKTGGGLACLQQCSSIADCRGGETCASVAGVSLKGCREQ